MALPATDDFTGNQSDPLSANWTTLDGSWVIGVNTANNASSQGNAAYWNADTFNDDQYSQCTVSGAGSSNGGGPGVRMAATRGYIAVVDSSSQISVYAWTGDEGYTLLGSAFTGLTLAESDVIRLEVSGTTLTLKQNGASLGTRTDSNYSSGSAGIFAYQLNLPVALDDWEGGNLSVAASSAFVTRLDAQRAIRGGRPAKTRKRRAA